MTFDTDQQCTHEMFATLVGISRSAVSALVGEGLLLREGTLGTWLHAYTARLREQAAGRMARDGIDLATERARLAKAHREKVERENSIARGELLPAELLAQQLAYVGARVSSILEAIPARIHVAAPEVAPAVLEVVRHQVTLARNECANLELPEALLPEDYDEHA